MSDDQAKKNGEAIFSIIVGVFILGGTIYRAGGNFEISNLLWLVAGGVFFIKGIMTLVKSSK